MTVTVTSNVIKFGTPPVQLLSLVQVDGTPQDPILFVLGVIRIWEGRLQLERPPFPWPSS
jgi:hypothetical protein